MSEPRRPVPLRPGALRALLRQPDLPPDLVAKISARADHLARVEQQRVARGGANGWRALWLRLPIILPVFAALVVVAGIAFMRSPVPPDAGPASSAPEAATAPSVIPLPVEMAPPATSERPIIDIVNAVPASGPATQAAIPVAPAGGSPSVSGRGNVAGARAKAAPAAGAVRPGVSKAPDQAAERQNGKTALKSAAPGSSMSVMAAPPSGAVSEAAPAVTVNLPAAVPMIELPAQP